MCGKLNIICYICNKKGNYVINNSEISDLKLNTYL